MKTFVLLTLGFFMFFYSCKTNRQLVQIDEIKVATPFQMPNIKTPNFNDCKKFSIVDFGAIKGNKESISKAIELAINKASGIGGGIVIIPTGEWVTGKIHLKSNVNLHLNKGAVLIFSDNPNDYLPAVSTTWEGMECYNYSPLIYAFECQNVAITGQGELKAEMTLWKKWSERTPAHMNSLKYLYNSMSKNSLITERQMVNDSSHLRPQFIQFNRCERVLLEGITITNSPFWVIHPYLSKDIVIRNLKVFAHGHNNDGVDPEMSQNILIENCEFDQGDDAIAVKSGRNQDGWRLNIPTKNLVIKNCIVKNGHQLLAIGSELSGGIENVFMDSCEVMPKAKLNHLVFIKTNERRGGYVKSIYVSNIKSGKIDKGVLGIETDVLYQWRSLVPTYKRKLTHISNIYLDNFHATNVKYVSKILGEKELPINNVILNNIVCDSIQDKKQIHESVVNYKETKNGKEL